MTFRKFATANGIVVNAVSGNVSVHINTADAIRLPSGNTGQRPTAAAGYLRFNSETNQLEYSNSSNWGSLATTGGANNEFATDIVFQANVTANGTASIHRANLIVNGTFANITANTEFRGNNAFLANQTFSGAQSWFNSNVQLRGSFVTVTANVTFSGTQLTVSANLVSTATINATTISFNGSTLTGNSTQINLSRSAVVNGTVTANSLTVNSFTVSANSIGLLFQSGKRLYTNAISINTTSVTQGFTIGDTQVEVRASNSSFDSRTNYVRVDTGAYATFGILSNNPDALQILGPTSSSSELAAIYEAATWRFYTGGSERVRITSAGRLGIGTTSPSTPLHVVGTSTLAGNTTISGFANISGNANVGGMANVSGNATFSGTKAVVDGNLGVGTSSPSSKLHVVGTGRITGATQIDGTLKLNLSAGTLSVNSTGYVTSGTVDNGYTLHVSNTSLSGTNTEFTSIPSTAQELYLFANSVQFNTIAVTILELGDSGGYETSGYLGGNHFGGTTTSSTSAFAFGTVNGFNGAIKLLKGPGNTWAMDTSIFLETHGVVHVAGIKTLSGTLDRIRFRNTSGRTFTGGGFYLYYR